MKKMIGRARERERDDLYYLEKPSEQRRIEDHFLIFILPNPIKIRFDFIIFISVTLHFMQNCCIKFSVMCGNSQSTNIPFFQ